MWVPVPSGFVMAEWPTWQVPHHPQSSRRSSGSPQSGHSPSRTRARFTSLILAHKEYPCSSRSSSSSSFSSCSASCAEPTKEKPLTNYIASVIRTCVPIAIGAAATWLAAHAGFVLDESSQAGLIVVATGSAIGIYYAIVRKVEQKYPQIGWLLGLAKPPAYPSDTPPQG